MDTPPFTPPLKFRPNKAKKRKIVPGPKVATTPINLDLKFEDLGGLEEQICMIQDEVIYCQKNAAALKKSGLEHNVGGVLLEGPPGTGKTICAHTIAAELVRQTGRSYSFYTHNAADCLSKWIGESEKTIRELFEAAASNKPSIIFFDEFDAICPRRDHEKSSQEHRTLVATILSEFNKIKENEILVIATTNLVTNIDPAMIRDGRFDFTINFPLPNERQRRNIIEIKMNNFMVPDGVLDEIAKQTEGFVGSALTLLCTRAQRNAFKRQKPKNGLLKYVDRIDFTETLKTSRIKNRNSTLTSSSHYNFFKDICKSLAQKVQPYIFFDTASCSKDDGISNVTNCFLIWSQDSNLILNQKFIPYVLQYLQLPAYTVNQDVLDNTIENFEINPVRTFKNIVNSAVLSGKPAILFIENIDSIDLPEEILVKTLRYTGEHMIFVLVTASRDLSQLSSQLQRLIVPYFEVQRSFKLPPPTDQEIGKLLEHMFSAVVQKKLRIKIPKKTFNTLLSKLLKTSRMLPKNRSYDALSAALSELRVQCHKSKAETLLDDIDRLFSQ